MRLYPFAKDESQRPLYLSCALQSLLENGDFANALKLIEDDYLLVNRIFGSEWALPYFVEAYGKLGQPEKELELCKRMQYSRSPEIHARIAILKQLLN